MKNRSKFVAICLSAALLTMSTMPGLAEENADPINPPEVTEPSEDTPVTPENPSVTEDTEVTTTTPAYNDSHQEADGTTVISGILLVNKEIGRAHV